MNYINYEVEDFLLDTSFQEYCMGTNEEAVHFWQKWLREHPEKFETAEQARTLYLLLNGNSTNTQFAEDKKKFRTAIEPLLYNQTITNERKKHEGIIRKLFFSKKKLAVAAAACILIAAGLGVVLNQKNSHNNTITSSAENIIVTKIGEHKNIQLPDGSKLVLNERSSVQFSKDFNNKTRSITLIGEAFFDVTHNPSKPFIIHTGYLDIKVLGTMFNVKSYPGQKFAETALFKGSVELTLRNEHNRKIILKPNEKVSVDYNELTPAPQVTNVRKSELNMTDQEINSIADNHSSIAEVLWDKPDLVFDNNSFEEIAIQLQRRYDIAINFEDESLKQYRFTGSFNDKNIMQVLDALQLSRHFNYEIKDSTKIFITK